MIFFFKNTATTEIYTLSLHDALPICAHERVEGVGHVAADDGGLPYRGRVDGAAHLPATRRRGRRGLIRLDRKSTRLNSSHANISYAVFCLKKKILLITSYLSYNTT